MQTATAKKLSKKWNLIGEWIRSQRESREMFQRELAEKLGIYQPDVSFYEKGTHVPDTGTCMRLAKVFGADVRDVLSMAMETNLARQIQQAVAS